MFVKNDKTPVFALCLLLALMLAPVQAKAAEETPANTHEITETISSVTAASLDKQRLLYESITTSIQKRFESLIQALVETSAWRAGRSSEVMPYYHEFHAVIGESVLSRFGAGNVKMKLDDIMHQMISAHEEVENASLAGEENPFAGTFAAGDGRVYQILTTTFCNPDSANAPTSCRNSNVTPYSNENFIDMFVGERTWSDKTIVDSLLVARRFFAPTPVRDVRAVYNETGFISNRSEMAQANLRMSILNNLAARRAPTSTATSSVLEFMFDVLASSSPFVMSTNSEDACAPENMTYSQGDSDTIKSAKFINGYVCSFTSAPVSGTGERFISEAAIDRIIQHDFYLSPNFYGAIQSGSFKSSSIDKMEVFMKAQQLAQDYRQLRLLQMKTAAVAMNMMN